MNRVTINGKAYKGTSVTVLNNRVIIDGKEVNDKDLPRTILEIEVKGNLASLQTDASVNCENVLGDVHAGGSVNCDNVKGSVSAGGSVNADDVGGDIHAGGGVIYG